MSIKITVEDKELTFSIEHVNVDMDIWDFTDTMIKPIYRTLGYSDMLIRGLFGEEEIE